MRLVQTVLIVIALAMLSPSIPRAQEREYDGCNETFYDSSEEPCGGGHQHAGGKRDDTSLDRARHRHRFLEGEIAELKAKLATLSREVEQLRTTGAE
jgi:hypothetical protein